MSNNTKKNKEVAGFVEQDGKYAVFVGNEFHFVFVPERHANELIDKAKMEEAEKNGEVVRKPQQVIFRGFSPEMTIKSENGFIRGKTYDGNTILIYTGHDIDLSPIYKVNTWLYIVSHGNYALDKCDAIRFRSGILRSLFVARSLDIKREKVADDSEGTKSVERDYLEYNDDSIKLDINGTDKDKNKKRTENTEIVKEIVVYSPVNRSWSINEGTKVGNDGVNLDLSFVNPENPTKIFKDCYNDISTLCQFMAFRQNVAFDEVLLLGHNKIEDEREIELKLADCYVKPYLQPEKLRDPIRCITFNELNANACSLYKLVHNRNKKKSKFVVNFIPESHNDVRWLSDKNIRDVCTSIELEASLNGIKAKKADAFDDLIEKVKYVIQGSKQTPLALTDREYSYIEGNITHWNGPAAELGKRLFDKYKDEVDPLLKFCEVSDLSENDIQSVIKIRNQLTHGGGVALEESIVNTVQVLMGVVYASILSRCGCESDLIKKIFQDGLMTVAS